MGASMTAARWAVYRALLAVYERDGRSTVRAVAAEAGRSVSTTHAHLCNLERDGYAASERYGQGTWRPRVARVVFVPLLGVEAR